MEGKQTQTRQVGAMQWLLAKANCVVSTVTSPVTSMCTRALLLADAVVENVRSKESQARQAEAGWRVRNTSLKFVVALKAVFVIARRLRQQMSATGLFRVSDRETGRSLEAHLPSV